MAFLFLFNGAYDVAWTPLSQSYTSEILPYRIRAKGMTIFAFLQAACTAVNQYVKFKSEVGGTVLTIILLVLRRYVNPVALEAIKWKYYTVYIALLVFYLVMVYLYFVETKGYTSEEVGALFDSNADAVVAQTLERTEGFHSADKFEKSNKMEHIETASA